MPNRETTCFHDTRPDRERAEREARLLIAFVQTIDEKILLWLQESVRCPILDRFLVPLTILGYCGTLWILISAVMLFFPKSRKIGWLSLLAMLLCYLFNDEFLKSIVQRPRPFLAIPELQTLVAKPASWSFPSGHACSSFAAASMYSRGSEATWLKGLFWCLALAMAFSRPYVGVHYPTDVLVGAVVGLLGSALTWRVFQRRYDRLEERIAGRGKTA